MAGETQYVRLEPIINDLEFVEISVYANSTIDSFYYTVASNSSIVGDFSLIPLIYPNSIESVSTLSSPDQLKFLIYPDSISSSANLVSELTFPLLIYDQTIYIDSVLALYSTVTINDVKDIQISEYVQGGISSTSNFGDSKLSLQIISNSIDSTVSFSANNQLNFILYSSSISSTAIFGWNDPLLNMQIRNTPNPEISSTVVIPSPNVLKVIGPLSIATTVNFELPSFTDSIHRLLIFKNDNITKVGNTDAVIVAGGIRINPSIAKTETAIAGSASLPSNPVGFISVNIDGNDYKIPYYN
ncbi:hypothetical protein EBS02_00110 [bacterium]|nr:hypothetical protein [bacterium]